MDWKAGELANTGRKKRRTRVTASPSHIPLLLDQRLFLASSCVNRIRPFLQFHSFTLPLFLVADPPLTQTDDSVRWR